MDNKAFRFDDRIWDAHYPPNGFNCRCMVKALTEEDLKEQKLQLSKSDGKLHEASQEVRTDKSAGEVTHKRRDPLRFHRRLRETPDHDPRLEPQPR